MREGASLVIATRADVKVVQQMLGHKSGVLTIDLYGHLFGDRLDVVADALDAAVRAADVYPSRNLRLRRTRNEPKTES